MGAEEAEHQVMAAGTQSLDIVEQQVAIDFFDDPAYQWHQRILHVKVSDAKWVVSTPDLEVEVCDLASHRVVPLVRAARFPERVVGNLYQFAPIGDAELEALRSDADALAVILGGTPAAAARGDSFWVFSDMADENFAEEVDPSVFRNPNAYITKGAHGLVETADGWTVMERVRKDDLSAWKDEKRTGPGRDPRVLPVERDARDTRFLSLRDALSAYKTEVKAPDDPWRGPSAIPELLDIIRGTGEELAGFHDFWVRHSGVFPESAAAHTHRALCSVLIHMISFDQLNVPALGSGEAVCRHLLRIERAVKRNPKAPDFTGLDIMTQSRLDAGGALLAGDFSKWTAEEHKSEAFILKQMRLITEETEKRQTQGGGGAAKK